MGPRIRYQLFGIILISLSLTGVDAEKKTTAEEAQLELEREDLDVQAATLDGEQQRFAKKKQKLKEDKQLFELAKQLLEKDRQQFDKEKQALKKQQDDVAKGKLELDQGRAKLNLDRQNFENTKSQCAVAWPRQPDQETLQHQRQLGDDQSKAKVDADQMTGQLATLMQYFQRQREQGAQPTEDQKNAKIQLVPEKKPMVQDIQQHVMVQLVPDKVTHQTHDRQIVPEKRESSQDPPQSTDQLQISAEWQKIYDEKRNLIMEKNQLNLERLDMAKNQKEKQQLNDEKQQAQKEQGQLQADREKLNKEKQKLEEDQEIVKKDLQQLQDLQHQLAVDLQHFKKDKHDVDVDKQQLAYVQSKENYFQQLLAAAGKRQEAREKQQNKTQSQENKKQQSGDKKKQQSSDNTDGMYDDKNSKPTLGCFDYAGPTKCATQINTLGSDACMRDYIFGRTQCCATCAVHLGAHSVALDDPIVLKIAHSIPCRDVGSDGSVKTDWCKKSVVGKTKLDPLHCWIPSVVNKCTKACGWC